MLAALGLILLFAAPGPADLLGSKDVAERLAAVKELREQGGEEAEKLLLRALADDDWEVMHRAAEALAKRGGEDSIRPLARLAVEGPVARIRLAAAESLKVINATEGAKLVAKRLKKRTYFEATRALAVLGDTSGAKQIERMLKNKDPEKRAAAVRALAGERKLDHIKLWDEMLKDPDVRVQIEAIGALVLTRDEYALRPLVSALKKPGLAQVLQRRYIRAIRDLVTRMKSDEQKLRAARICIASFGTSSSGEVNARYARLLGVLGAKGHAVGPVQQYAERLVSAGIGHSDLVVRRATVAALARIGAESAWEKIHEVAVADKEWKVRFHALRAAVALRGEKALGLVLGRLRYDESIGVREEAAVLASRIPKPEAAKSLIEALKDGAWQVRTCAAVSLGKLHAPEGVAPLLVLAAAKDWRDRGSAAAGLARIRSKKAIPVLIGMLKDRSPSVAATAREALRHIAGKNLKEKELLAWWEKKGPTFVFVDPDKAAREAKKYGYAVTRRGVYEDLDIVVLVTRAGGDHIQFLLTDYEIDHREIRSASISKQGIAPYSLFVANCPGDVVKDDVEQLRWFVRAGGYLFASCWALTHTVELSFPEVIDKLPLKGQVIGNVEAVDVNPENPYMKGVFDRATSPLYSLMGSHLIRVLDPERCEVLIDSPQAASIWGDGNLAAWFSVGHGTILDSANHFDLQGMKDARLRTATDRMAFAMDRLGYDYKELRELKEQGVFRKANAAIKATRDLSTFRFISTFVREKRIADEG